MNKHDIIGRLFDYVEELQSNERIAITRYDKFDELGNITLSKYYEGYSDSMGYIINDLLDILTEALDTEAVDDCA